jgi:predicted Rossmann fold nucleotide-binding protein DprA/Smf involved in DNA uptake
VVVPVADVTDEMVEAAAEALWKAETSPHTSVRWDSPLLVAVRDRKRTFARAALSAALADRVVVAPPPPDDTDGDGDPVWLLGDDAAVIAYCDVDGVPQVQQPIDNMSADETERYAAVLLAGVRESRRLAAEYQAELQAVDEALGELETLGLVERVEGGEARG